MRGTLVAALLSLSLFQAVGVSATAPYISTHGVVNAASLTPPSLPGGSIARGSRFQITGEGIGPAKDREDSKFPLKHALGGVTIAVTAGTTTYHAWPTFVSPTVVTAVLPSAVPAGPVTLRLTFNGQTSNPVRVAVVEHSPGLFSVNGMGYGPGAVFDKEDVGDHEENDHRNSTANAHRRGRSASLLATGFGAAPFADHLPPRAHDASSDVEILIGGAAAQKFFVRRSFKRPGTDELSFRIPDTAPLGCYVPVQVIVHGVASNLVTMAITDRGKACTDDFNPGSTVLRDGGNVAFALLSRVVIQSATGNRVADQTSAVGRRMKRNDLAFERRVSLPPAGTCTAYTIGRGLQTVVDSFPGSPLYLGQLTVANAAKTSRPIPFIPPSLYEVTWGADDPAAPRRVPLPPFLDPGRFTFAGTGAEHVGPFAVQRTLADPPVWTNAADTSDVTRSADLTVTWSGAGARRVFVMGSASNRMAGATSFFSCVANAGATSLVVPATILERLPAVHAADRSTTGAIEVGAFAEGTPARFSAAGLDSGVLYFTTATAQPVRFK
jgi:uncharacterized protein (TIGR03437 family)